MTNIFERPPHIPTVLTDEQTRRAAALVVAQQVLRPTTRTTDLVAVAEYVVDGEAGFFASLADADAITADQQLREDARRQAQILQFVDPQPTFTSQPQPEAPFELSRIAVSPNSDNPRGYPEYGQSEPVERAIDDFITEDDSVMTR